MQGIIDLKACKYAVQTSNTAWWGALVYADKFTTDAIHKCGKALLGLPSKIFLSKIFQADSISKGRLYKL